MLHNLSIRTLNVAALTRFELLNCGYWAPNAISTVDSLLSRNIQEIVNTVSALSKSIINADGTTLASLNDEQSFQSALTILKNVGSLKRDLNLFTGQVSEQMRALATRMAKANEFRSSSCSTSIHHANYISEHNMPEELSSKDIQLFLAKAACANDDEDDKVGTDILLSLAEKEPGLLFPDFNMTLGNLIQRCQYFVCDVCSAIPRYNLRALSTLSVWRNDFSEDDRSMDEPYGSLPQSLITQIGEHLLSLVQIFEPFASDPIALSLGNTAMENISHVPVPLWRDFVKTVGCHDELQTSSIMDLISGSSLTDLILINVGSSHHENESDDEVEAETSSTIFCNQWLNVISSTVTAVLLDQTMKVTKLSPMGCDQLASDYGYLMNVLSALGLPNHPHKLLGHVVQVSRMSDDEIKSRIELGKLTYKKSGFLVDIVYLVDRRLAQLRGLTA